MDKSQTRYRFNCEHSHSERAPVRRFYGGKLGYRRVCIGRRERKDVTMIPGKLNDGRNAIG